MEDINHNQKLIKQQIFTINNKHIFTCHEKGNKNKTKIVCYRYVYRKPITNIQASRYLFIIHTVGRYLYWVIGLHFT
jgi:hypothetical protein